MQDYLIVLEKARELSPKARRDKLIPLATNSIISQSFNYIFANKNARELMRALVDLSSDKQVSAIVAHYIDINSNKLVLLMENAEDAKLKKSCAQLLGKLRPDEFSQTLMECLSREKTEFVKPSIILALGNAKNSEGVYDFLKDYRITAEEKKHVDEQRLALDKAMSMLKSDKLEYKMINPLEKGTKLLLNCPSVRVSQREITALGYDAAIISERDNYLLVKGVLKYRRIFAARSFYKAYIVFNEFTNFQAALTAAASNKFIDFVRNLYGEGELEYRISITGEASREERKKFSESLASKIRQKGFMNSPSAYMFEIAIVEAGRGYFLTILPQNQLDDRFDYKKMSISASIHPAAAASCVSFISPYLKDEAKVLDCFCGSGTMLFERAKRPYGSLMGTDIAKEALKAARLNEKFAKTGAHFYLKNALSNFEDQFDEVICNLPFGLRVGSHMKNEQLYSRFLSNLKGIVKKGGYAFLFTHDKKLLIELIDRVGIELVSKHTFSCGGLYPSMFVLKIN